MKLIEFEAHVIWWYIRDCEIPWYKTQFDDLYLYFTIALPQNVQTKGQQPYKHE